MAYNRVNYILEIGRITALYTLLKEADKPDTFIVRSLFPKHGVFISYRKWMNIKGMKPSGAKVNPNQLQMF